MKLFFAGSYTPRELEILVEYRAGIMSNWSTIDANDPLWAKLRTGEIDDVIFDSGGFQLQTHVDTKRKINIPNYALWLELTLRDYPNIKYMALDKLDDNPTSMKQLAELESYGLHPIPIWHSGNVGVYDPVLDFYCNNYDYIAIGGIALRNRKNIYQLMERLMQQYPHMKFHLLGVGLAVSYVCKVYIPYSADASSWLAPARWGSEIVFDGKDIKLRDMSKEDRKAIRKNDDVRTMWSRKAIHNIKEFEKVMNNKTLKPDIQLQMFRMDNSEVWMQDNRYHSDERGGI